MHMVASRRVGPRSHLQADGRRLFIQPVGIVLMYAAACSTGSWKPRLGTFASNQSIRHSTFNLPSTPHLECCLHSGESAETPDANPAPVGDAACQACGVWPSATASPDPADRYMRVVAYSLQICTGTCFPHSIMDEPALVPNSPAVCPATPLRRRTLSGTFQ